MCVCVCVWLFGFVKQKARRGVVEFANFISCNHISFDTVRKKEAQQKIERRRERSWLGISSLTMRVFVGYRWRMSIFSSFAQGSHYVSQNCNSARLVKRLLEKGHIARNVTICEVLETFVFETIRRILFYYYSMGHGLAETKRNKSHTRKNPQRLNPPMPKSRRSL